MPTLAAAEERWRLTIDNAPVGIALVSLEGRFLRVNNALCTILGYTSEELSGLTFQALTHPADLDSDLGMLDKLLAGDVPSYRMRKRYVHADGRPVWADLSVGLVRDARGKPLHFVSHVADLSEEVKAHERIEQINEKLRRQQARLERSNADLEAFAMLASHDLQAPLATIRGYLELLQDEYGDMLDDRANEWLDRGAHAAARMSELVNSLLDFSLAGEGRVPERDLVPVAELVDEVREDLDQLVRETGTVLEVAGDPPPVLAERARLRQVLQNLVQNAIKYRSPERTPRVVITVAEGRTSWRVTVADNAVGIPDEHRESMFSMFSRIGDAEAGHGIGLAACRQIIERHGGQIWVEDNPGGGSRFCFTLPRP